MVGGPFKARQGERVKLFRRVATFDGSSIVATRRAPLGTASFSWVKTHAYHQMSLRDKQRLPLRPGIVPGGRRRSG
jgi:hypothetical protein